MVMKYKVPEKYRKNVYDNKKTIYCEILQEIKLKNIDEIVYKVKMLNYNNFTNIFDSEELKELNILDKIKLKLGGFENE